MWLAIVLINVMILLNFLIVTIEGAYEDLKDLKIESAYQKKANILKDLDDVFGKYIDTRFVNILVVRQGVEAAAREEVDEHLDNVRKELLIQKEVITEKIHEMNNNMEMMRGRLDVKFERALDEIE
jgi:hypothetical protein